MYRVKAFHVYAPFYADLEEEVNEFLMGKDIEIVDCKMHIDSKNYITYVIMYKIL